MVHDELELAWAAGFFDGEGCVTHESRETGIYIRLSVTQCGSDFELNELTRILGYGRVVGPYEPSGSFGVKERFHWNVNGNSASGHVMELLRPYLRGPKIETYDRLRGQ